MTGGQPHERPGPLDGPTGGEAVVEDGPVRKFVWVDAWQQQCCGTAFGIGSRVDWTVRAEAGRHEWVDKLLGASWAEVVHFSEDHHAGAAGSSIIGTVVGISVVTSLRELGEAEGRQAWIPVPGGGRLEPSDVADPWTPKRSLDRNGTWNFDGWIVELDGARVSSIK